MKERVLLAVFPPGRTADNYDGRFFGIRAGDGVEDVEPAHAVGHTHQTNAVNARISVGSEAGAGLMGHGDALDFGLFEPGESGEGEVPGNAEAMTDAAAVKIVEEELS